MDALEILPVPRSKSALQQWAARYGVADQLEISSQDPRLRGQGGYTYRLYYLPPAPLRELLVDPPDHPMRAHFPGRSYVTLQNELRLWLLNVARSRAQVHVVEAGRVEGWRRALHSAKFTHPVAVVALGESLLVVRAELAGRLSEPDPARSTATVSLSAHPLEVQVLGQMSYPLWGHWNVRVDLAGWPATPAVLCATHPSGEPCVQKLEALAHLLDFLLHPRQASQFDPLWLAELKRPSWERFIAEAGPIVGLDSPPVSATAPAGLLSWRVTRPAPGELAIEAVQHKRTRSQGWSPGTRVAVKRGIQAVSDFATPADHRALELWVACADTARSESGQRLLFRALEHLVGHPHVYLASSSGGLVSLQLQPGSLGLQVEQTPEGLLVPTPRLNGSAELAQQALGSLQGTRTSTLVIDHPPGASSARGYLVTVDPRSLALLHQVERYRPQLPASAGPQLLSRLAPVEDRLPVELPPALAGELRVADPHPLLRLRLESVEGLEVGAPRREALQVQVVMRPLPGGPVQIPGEGAEELSRFEGALRIRVRRDLLEEQAAAEALIGRLPFPAETEVAGRWQRRLGTRDEALDFIVYLQSLPAEGATAVRVEWLEGPVRLVRDAQPQDLRVHVSDQRDWFGLEGEIEVDGEHVKLAALLEAVRHRARYVEVGPRRWMALSQKLREQLGAAADVVHEGRQGLEVSPVAAHALADLLDGAQELKVSTRWRILVRRLGAARTREFAVPQGIKAKLRPYQAEGYAWLMRLAECGFGAVLADDMGLGKTLEALAVLDSRASAGPALVLAPTSVCSNWQREAKRFAPDLEVTRYAGPASERWATLEDLEAGEVVVTSYGLLLEDAERFQKVSWSTLVLDEAQALKNPGTRRARAVRDLKSEWSVALTGTPIENHVGELWSLFRVVAPGLLGSWDQFRSRFALPIERRRDPERVAALARVVRPFILRRTKGEVAQELPKRTEVQLAVTLSRGERRLYDAARLSALAKLGSDAGDDQRFEVLAALTRLRQLACHPRLHDPESSERSSKLERLLELIEELREEGHRALVFSQFTSHLALVREALDAQKVPYRYLDGSTPAKQRDVEVDAFQRGEGDLFLISLKAGGTGLNLTGADYVIHLDPWWNPAVEDQATDRAHRIGQTKAVTVYRLVTQGTIEEAILALHAEKRDLVAGLLEGTGRAGKLSTAQLVDLIRTGAAPAGEETSDDALGELDDTEKGSGRGAGRHLRLVGGTGD